MSAQEIFALRRQGNCEQALQLARQEFINTANQQDEWFIRAYAWVLYDFANKIAQNYKNNRISSTQLNQQYGRICPDKQYYS